MRGAVGKWLTVHAPCHWVPFSGWVDDIVGLLLSQGCHFVGISAGT